MNRFLKMTDTLNRMAQAANRKAEEVNAATRAWSEKQIRRTEYCASAERFIKEDDFVDDLEKEVMQQAAHQRDEWRRNLAAELATDRILAACFAKRLAEVSNAVPVPPGGLMEVEHEKCALEAARQSAAIERELQADPELRRFYDEAGRALRNAGDRSER